MRELYGARQELLLHELQRHLGDALHVPTIPAGMSTPAFLARGIAVPRVIAQAARHALDLWPLDRFALERRDLRGLLLGFAAFGDRQIRDGVLALTRAIEAATGRAVAIDTT
jgi:GntR family transcriptional regulator/MocR family aminotransferase